MIEGRLEELKASEGEEIIKCREQGCDLSMLFTQRDRDFFAQNGWDGKPSRCKQHRAENKARREKEKFKKSNF